MNSVNITLIFRMGKDYYTKEEVARLLPSSYPVILDMISKGELAELYNGKERVIAAQTVNDFMLGRLVTSNNQERHEAAQKTSPGPLNWSKNLQLYPWQAEALNWWSEQGCHGVIEAVTGAGKTRVAIAAAEDQLRTGGRVVIVVPTKELLSQWRREVEKLLLATCGMRISIGLLGDGRVDTLRRSDVLLTTPHSAHSRDLRLPSGKSGLIVADEVHRYGTEKWSKVLKPSFDRRLGLTATYEREDTGLEKFLSPYFGDMFSVDYRRALADGVIAPFKIAFVAVRFSPDERKLYEESSEKAYKYKKRLVNEYGLPEEPFGEFMRETTLLSKSGEEGARFAGYYLSAFSKRRQVLAGAKGKYERVVDLLTTAKVAKHRW